MYRSVLRTSRTDGCFSRVRPTDTSVKPRVSASSGEEWPIDRCANVIARLPSGPVGAATLLVLAVFLTPVLLTIAGGVLIRGQASIRGPRFWLGAVLLTVGVLWFVSSQVVLLAL